MQQTVCGACCVVLLALRALPARAKETDLVVLGTYTSSALRDERYVRWAASAAWWGARARAAGGARAWAGHGTKLNVLRAWLQQLRGAGAGWGERLVLYTDSFDVLFTGPLREMAARFRRHGARVLFAAERACWPDAHLAAQYPPAPEPGYRYLNAGAVIGYASSLLELVSLRAVHDHEDDQRYYTHAYLNDSVRERLQLALDHRAEIFQCLAGAAGEVRVEGSRGERAHVLNTRTGTRPLLLHGNGEHKHALWTLELHLARSWARHPASDAHLQDQGLPELRELYGLEAGDDDAPDY